MLERGLRTRPLDGVGSEKTHDALSVRAHITPSNKDTESSAACPTNSASVSQSNTVGTLDMERLVREATERVHRGEDAFAGRVASLDQAACGALKKLADLKAAAAAAATGLDGNKTRGRPKKKGSPISAIEARNKIDSFLKEIRAGDIPEYLSERTATDLALESLNWKDLPALRRAHASLSIKAKDKKINLVFRGRIVEMVELLNLYLDPQL